MAVVCLLCGLWHGANWTFLIWGVYHGVFLVVERLSGIRNIPSEKYIAIRRVVTLVIVAVGWVLFRSEDISQAIGYVGTMFTASELSLALNYRNLLFMLIAATVFFMPRDISGIKIFISSREPVPILVGALMILLLLPYCAALIAGGSSSPFIYYRF